MNESSEPASDSRCSRKFTNFSEISKIALKRQNEVIDFINGTDWELDDCEHSLHYIFPPSQHLVPAAWKEVQKAAQRLGLYVVRKRLTKEELDAYKPRITRKSGGYFVCVSNDEETAITAIQKVKESLVPR